MEFNKIHADLQEQEDVFPVGCVRCFTSFAAVHFPATAEEMPMAAAAAAELIDGGSANVGEGGRRQRGEVGVIFTLTNIPIVDCFEFLRLKGIFVF